MTKLNVASNMESNLRHVQDRISAAANRAGRKPEDITLIAVSKTFGAESIQQAYALGLRHFGENRVQEWDSKRAPLAGLEARWHLIGHLQSNKARRAAEIFDTVDSVDSLSLAQKLNGARAESASAALDVLIEVQLAPEDSKSGVSESELPAVVEAVLALPSLKLRGLMAIPPFLDRAEDVRKYFRKLHELRDSLQPRLGAGTSLSELSMGMSHDFEVAIEEGATQIRVGTALFGSRPRV